MAKSKPISGKRPSFPAGKKTPTSAARAREHDSLRGARVSQPALVAALAIIIICATAIAYANSLHSSFLFDDPQGIVENPHVRALWPPHVSLWEALQAPPNSTPSCRPLLSLTLALNYTLAKAWGASGSGGPSTDAGLEVSGYHAVNLGLHILAALVLFGLVRRTLMIEALRGRFGRHARVLGGVSALLWALHPIQTESVAYVIQRGEPLMALFYLLTLYCALRGHEAAHPLRWHAAAACACALGMASKEVMVTAPFMVVAYDRLFLYSSLREMRQRRLQLYLMLASTWTILLASVLMSTRADSVGYNIGVGAWEYARTQYAVTLHYLRLSLWPDTLVFDYGWPIANRWQDYVPQGIVIAGLLGAVVWGLIKRAAWSFAGVWFFLILSPSSSILPIVTEVAAEHRMYLPLAALTVTLVIGVYLAGGSLIEKWPGITASKRQALGWSACILTTFTLAGVLGRATYLRNLDYASEMHMWEDTVAKRSGSSRAQNNLGSRIVADAIGMIGRGDPGADQRMLEGIGHLRRAIEISFLNPDAHDNLGSALAAQGRALLARARQTAAAGEANAARSDFMQARAKYDASLEEYRTAANQDPTATILADLGDALYARNAMERDFQQFSGAGYTHDEVNEMKRRLGEALDCYRKSLASKFQPRIALNYASIIANAEDTEFRNPREAFRWAEKALNTDAEKTAVTPVAPAFCYDVMSVALASMGQFDAAVHTEETALADGPPPELANLHMPYYRAHKPVEMLNYPKESPPSAWARGRSHN